MTNQKNETQDSSQDKREQAAIALANEFLNRATLGEALSQISLNALIQLSQSRAIEQGKEEIKNMNDQQVDDLLENIQNSKQQAESTAQQVVDEVTNETAEAS